MSGWPLRDDTKAKRLPSGAHDGDVSMPHWFVRRSEGLSSILGDEETYNVFVCDENGEVMDWGGLCHQNYSFDGPQWLYSLANAQD